MKASLFYRIASVLLVLFALGHTLGFRESDPKWGVDTLFGLMQSIHFDVQGFSRTYWDLFVAAGLSVGVFYFFAAILAWQLGGLPAETLSLMRGTVWAFAVCFAAITAVSWTYLFILPIVFSMVITVCLICSSMAVGEGNLTDHRAQLLPSGSTTSSRKDGERGRNRIRPQTYIQQDREQQTAVLVTLVHVRQYKWQVNGR